MRVRNPPRPSPQSQAPLKPEVSPEPFDSVVDPPFFELSLRLAERPRFPLSFAARTAEPTLSRSRRSWSLESKPTANIGANLVVRVCSYSRCFHLKRLSMGMNSRGAKAIIADLSSLSCARVTRFLRRVEESSNGSI